MVLFMSDVSPLAVINHGGRDPFIDYAEGPGYFEQGVHPPVNFHAYAAATRGAFFDDAAGAVKDERFTVCLVLLRSKPQAALDAVKMLKAAGRRVWVSWKECGQAQIAAQLSSARTREIYRQILALCDGMISPTLVAPPSAESLPVQMIPTPYPVEFKEWNYDVPVDGRKGIFLGTREFFAPTRNHLNALITALRVAVRTGTFVTVINTDKGKGKKLLDALKAGEQLRVVDGTLTYLDYLKLIARHRAVFQLDRSVVPGQVAGDALLARVPCIGGNSAIEQLAFPEICHPALSEPDAEIYLESVMTDDAVLGESVARSQALALEKVSFGAIASHALFQA